MINRRFLIKKKLGQGRSAVYLCEDLEQTGKYFALKILSANSDEEEIKIFKNEFQTIQNLDHTNIIKAYERGTIVEVSDNENISIGSKYLAMEYFDGSELGSYPIDDELILREIIAQICSVLFYLHQSKYIYYDLKPENILVGEVNGKPLIKLIDLGFARIQKKEASVNAAGTAEYLAPEILKKEPHDHRVDLYSFGILLYRLIYKKFPFQSQNQLEIYKEHIEIEFSFPETKLSAELTAVVKKLLKKNPEERYFTSIQILYDLNISITEELYSDWVPIRNFSDRTDILNIVNRYVSTQSSGEIIIIRGFERAGKTTVSQEIFSRYKNVVQLSNDRTKSGFGFVKSFLNKLIFNDFVFHLLSLDTLALVNKILNSASENLTNDLKLVVNKVTSLNQFILLLDDFNSYDNFALEIFREIFPIFQVNGCNVFLTEKSDLDYVTGFINNAVTLDLTSFTTAQIDELLKNTYADFFPLDEVRQLIMRHADFLPGNVMEFLRDLVLLKIIQFEYDGIKIVSDDNIEKVLVNLYDEIYKIRFKSLNEDELKVSALLSSFEILPDNKILVQLTDFHEDRFAKIIEDLQRKHVLQSQSQTGLNFSSDGIKNFIYSQIPETKKHHEKIAKIIQQKFPQFSKVELARQFEIGEDFDKSYSLLMSEAEEAEKISALKYERDILEQSLKLPLKIEQAFDVKFKLTSLYDTLNDFKKTYSITSDLLKENLTNELKNELSIHQGNSLIRTGEIERGMEILKSQLPVTKDEKKKLKLLLHIAGAELDINNYEAASEICKNIINNSTASSENKGDAYNLLGLCDFQQNNDLKSSLTNFENSLGEYESAESMQRIATIEINIGNIFNIKGEVDEVEKHWNKSLEISSSLGNYYHQAQVLLNFGIYYYNRQSFERAIQNYQRASLIFNTLGDNLGLARSESNLGEVFLFICDYQNALDSLSNAIEIFRNLRNSLEESETLFLLGKLYYRIGYYKKLSEIIAELQKLSELNESSQRINLHLNFLQTCNRFDLQQEVDADLVRKVADDYLIQEERINYFETIRLLINYFLLKKEGEKALEIISEKDFVEICNSNEYLKAEKFYLIAKIVSIKPVPNYEPPTYYLTEALALMDNLNVIEITYKVILELSSNYFERGNFPKAKEYASYGKSIIKFLADKFRDVRMTDMYLESPSRKKIWEKFTEILDFN